MHDDNCAALESISKEETFSWSFRMKSRKQLQEQLKNNVTYIPVVIQAKKVGCANVRTSAEQHQADNAYTGNSNLKGKNVTRGFFCEFTVINFSLVCTLPCLPVSIKFTYGCLRVLPLFTLKENFGIGSIYRVGV